MAIRNETGAHLALQETAREVNPARIGANFHKPAPRRAPRRIDHAKVGRQVGAAACFLALLVAGAAWHASTNPGRLSCTYASGAELGPSDSLQGATCTRVRA